MSLMESIMRVEKVLGYKEFGFELLSKLVQRKFDLGPLRVPSNGIGVSSWRVVCGVRRIIFVQLISYWRRVAAQLPLGLGDL